MAQHLMLCSTTYAWCSNLYVAASKFIAVIASLVTILNCRVAIMRRLVCGPRFIQHTAVSDARGLLQLVCPAGEGSVTVRRRYAAGHHATLSPFFLALAFHAAGPHRSEGTCIQKTRWERRHWACPFQYMMFICISRVGASTVSGRRR